MGKEKNKKEKIIKALRLLLIPLVLGAAALLIFGKTGLVHRLPPCPIRKQFHFLCPGCGMTRAIESLLGFNIIRSIRYNPLAVVLALLFALFYSEQVINLFSPGKRLLPRNKLFYIVLATALTIYFILRNLPFGAFLSIG